MTKLIDVIKTRESQFKIDKKDSEGKIFTFTQETLQAGGNSVAVTSISTTTSTDYYSTAEATKTLIVLHYTAGQLVGDIGTLTKNGNHVSVAYVIARDGTIYRLFDDKYWSYHLGPGTVGGNETNSKRSIGIEISNFGWVTKDGTKFMTYSNSHYCDVADEHGYVELDADYRGKRYFASFTGEQYTSIRLLLKYLTAKYNIPYRFIDDDRRHETFASAGDATQYQGIACHTNFRSDKWDLSPAFDWKKIYVGQPGYPTDVGSGLAINDPNTDLLHRHIEKDHPGGYYPIAANSMWHGGVHLNAERGAPVHAVYGGKIVAARLSDDEALAIRHYGSANFILVKHSISGSRLNQAQLRGKLLGYAITDDLRLRSAPSTSGSEIGTLKKDDEVVIVDESQAQANGYTWAHVKVQKSSGSLLNQVGYCALIDTRLSPVRETLSYTQLDPQKEYSFYSLYMHLNPERLDKENAKLHGIKWIQTKESTENSLSLNGALIERLRTGEVVQLDIPIEAGDMLGAVGEYGSSAYRTGLLHWEIFSEENLMPSWTKVEDTDDDFNLDSEKIVGLVQKEFWENDGLLSGDEVISFYKDNPKAAMLRYYACRFVSEWSVDLDHAIPLMKGRQWYSSWGLKGRMEPYMWWKDAASKSVSLPSSNKLWFYHPVSFCHSLMK